MPRHAKWPEECKYEGCARDHYARGYCKGHYQQHMRRKGMAPIQERAGRPARTYDVCQARWQAEDGWAECHKPVLAKGYCPGHYHQNHKSQPLRALRGQ